MYKVYKHTFPNGKIYIGIALDIYKRWNDGEGYKENLKMYSDIQKYGWDNITHEILIEDIETKEEAELKERSLIIAYDSENPEIGYNRTTYKRDLLKIKPKEVKPKEKKEKNKSWFHEKWVEGFCSETLDYLCNLDDEDINSMNDFLDININDWFCMKDPIFHNKLYKLPKNFKLFSEDFKLYNKDLCLISPVYGIVRTSMPIGRYIINDECFIDETVFNQCKDFILEIKYTMDWVNVLLAKQKII